jgi:putative tricarboxylic transport membrane protein
MRQDHSDKKGDWSLRMQRKNLYSAIFLVLFSAITIHLAIRLPLGHTAKPGPGLFPLLMSVFIAFLAFLLFFTTVLSNRQPNSGDSEMPARKWKVFYLLGQLCVYAFLYRRLGYIVSTWIFLVSLKPLIQTRWVAWIFTSLLISAVFFVFFSVLLKVELPVGILRL